MDHDGGDFMTTRWSLVEAAGAADDERARHALASVCQAYWLPLYAFVRRRGVAAADAEDVVQGFFARLVETRDLAKFVRGEARFRSFLRTAIANYLANVRAGERAAKRGGGRVVLAIDAPDAERRLALAPAQDASPEDAFDRDWAREVIRIALEGLRADYERTGRGAVFTALEPFLQAGEGAPPIADVARRLEKDEVAVRVALHRLRERFRRRLDSELAGTLTDPAAVAEERGRLLRALARP